MMSKTITLFYLRSVILLTFLLWIPETSAQVLLGYRGENRTDTVSLPPLSDHISKEHCKIIASKGMLDSLWTRCETNGMTTSIVHLGDSHVQAGFFTLPIRDQLARLFKFGGNGWIAPYKLYRTNQPINTRVSSSSRHWKGYPLTSRDISSGLGPGGIVMKSTSRKSQTVHLEDQLIPDTTFDRIIIYRSPQSQQPTPTLGFFKQRQSYSLSTPSPIAIDTLDAIYPQSTATIKIPPHCEWYGAQLQRRDGGVITHTIGLNGAFFSTYNKVNYGSYLSVLEPQLIIISLGTNDGLVRNFSEFDFELEVESLVNNLRRQIPSAKIIITSPIIDYRRIRVRRRRHRYVLNTNIKKIEMILRNKAKKLECGYIDLFHAFGGEKSAAKLIARKILSADHIHLTKEGYHHLGQAISYALINDYNDFIKRERSSLSKPNPQDHHTSPTDSTTNNDNR